MSKTWVLVADGARARIFELGRSRGELREIEDMVHAEGRLHERDLASDNKGRAFDSMGAGRHAMEHATSPATHADINFARRLDARLRSALNEGQYKDLVLIAPPKFLGELRQGLDHQVLNAVKTQIDKDLTQHPIEDILAHLP